MKGKARRRKTRWRREKEKNERGEERERKKEGEWRSREKEPGREGQNKQINVRVACLLLGGDTVTTPLSSTPSESVTFPAAPSSLVPHYQRPWLARSLPTEAPATRRSGVYTVVEVTSAAPMPGMQQAAFGWSPKPPEWSRATCPLCFSIYPLPTIHTSRESRRTIDTGCNLSVNNLCAYLHLAYNGVVLQERF